MARPAGGRDDGVMKRKHPGPPAQDSPPESPQARSPSGNTSTAQGETQQPVPRMPHEHDESSDQQAQGELVPSGKGRLAHDDVVRGVADTTRSVEIDDTYHRLRQGAPDGEKDDARQGPGVRPSGRRASNR